MKEQVRILLQAKPVLPGSLEEHYNVCGKAQCCCKDKVNPQKHGPYYRLSYSLKGKNSSVFVKKEDAPAIMAMTESYRESRSNIQHLALAMVELYRQKGLECMLNEYNRQVDRAICKKSGTKPEAAVLRDTRISRDKWKKKALERQSEIDKMQVKIRDLEKSRGKWKEKAIQAKEENQELKKLGLLKTADEKKKTGISG